MKQRNAMPNNLLSSLLEQLESASDGIVYLAPEQLTAFNLPDIQCLRNAGMLQESQPLTNVICDGCDWRCPKSVDYRYDAQGRATAAFVICDERDDIGRVPVSFGRLEMRTFTMAGVAAWLAKALPTDRSPMAIEDGDIFQIGVARIKGKRHDIFLCRHLQDHPIISNAKAPIIIAVNGNTQYGKYPSVAASSLIYFDNGQVHIDTRCLHQAIQRYNMSDEVALEISLVNSEIILINHVTDSQITIAKTDFDSKNDNAFEYLYNNAGKRLTEKELAGGAEIDGINLQKFVDQLHFKGNLRKLFFQVSKGAIRFNRTVTFSQLHALNIDPGNPI